MSSDAGPKGKKLQGEAFFRRYLDNLNRKLGIDLDIGAVIDELDPYLTQRENWDLLRKYLMNRGIAYKDLDERAVKATMEKTEEELNRQQLEKLAEDAGILEPYKEEREKLLAEVKGVRDKQNELDAREFKLADREKEIQRLREFDQAEFERQLGILNREKEEIASIKEALLKQGEHYARLQFRMQSAPEEVKEELEKKVATEDVTVPVKLRFSEPSGKLILTFTPEKGAARELILDDRPENRTALRQLLSRGRRVEPIYATLLERGIGEKEALKRIESEGLPKTKGKHIFTWGQEDAPEIPEKKPPPVSPKVVVVKPRPEGLTPEEVKRLQYRYESIIFAALGKIPHNALSVFNDAVFNKGLRLMTFEEALKQVESLAKVQAEERIMERDEAAIARRVGIGRPRPPPFTPFPEVSLPPEPSFPERRLPGARMAGLPYPRAPSSEEKDDLWKTFYYRMQVAGYQPEYYRRQFEELVLNTVTRSWAETTRNFEVFLKEVERSELTGTEFSLQFEKIMPWRGYELPAEIRGETEEMMYDAVLHLLYGLVSEWAYNGRVAVQNMEQFIEHLWNYGFKVTEEQVRTVLKKAWKERTEPPTTNQRMWIRQIASQPGIVFLAKLGIKPEELV